MYITKSNLEKLLSQHYKAHNDYPKPFLFIITMLLTLLAFIAIVVIALVIFIIGIIYAFIFMWIDLILGKYIIKRIFK